ncbi:MAG TPA: guanylate kinase [Candidatus Thioglobus sp.]|jgi:guanylate kinase|nr:guanylate kinase [Candidatus Thioglobus sp.]HIK77251.1 guanylate kinase [Gammaproteobacteria bacterium]
MNNNTPHLVVISAPSGTGKTTLVRALLASNSNMVASVSYTTRTKRANELDGEDYNFVTNDVFESMIANGDLLEYAKVFGNHYGTPKKDVNEQLSSGHNVILEIDWQGAIQVKQKVADCLLLFILPPSKNELMSRLQKRGTDSNEQIKMRFDEALNDIKQFEHFDRVFVNQDINVTVNEILAYIEKPNLNKTRLPEDVLSIIKGFQ